MRVRVLVALALLAVAGGAAVAQSYGAASIGFPAVFSVHLGFEDLLAPAVDLRVNLGGAAIVVDGGLGFGVLAGADVLFRTPSDAAARWVPYGGVGAGIGGLGFLGGGEAGVVVRPVVSGVVGIDLVFEGMRLFVEGRGDLLLLVPEATTFGFLGGRLGVKFPL